MMRKIRILEIIILNMIFLAIVTLNYYTGIEIIVLRQILAFICILLVPGTLLLYIFKIRMSFVKTILHSIGLSLFMLIIIGLMLNFLGPVIGIAKPISEIPIILTLVSLNIWLSSIFYLKSRNKEIELFFQNIKTIPPLYSILLPFTSVLGTFLLDYYCNNLLILLLFTALSLIPVCLMLFFKTKEENLMLTTFTIALSLVLYNSLFGLYMRPTDNRVEYYFSNAVITNGFWNSSIPNSINAMPAITIIIPILSETHKISLVWVYKLIVPILSAFIPVALYCAYKDIGNNDKIAFLSAFFLTSMFFYFSWISVTMKLMSGTLFLSLLFLTMYDKKISPMARRGLSVIYAFSLVTSYYGWSYVFLISLVTGFLLLYLLQHFQSTKLFISLSFVMMYIGLTLAWNMYTSSDFNFEFFVKFSRTFINSIVTEFIFPKGVYGVELLMAELPPYLHFLKIIYIFLAMLTFIYLIFILYQKLKNKTIDDYTVLCIPFLFFLGAPYMFGAVGNFAGAGGFAFYSYLLLAPLCIKAILNTFELLLIHLQHGGGEGIIPTGTILCVFFMLNSGLAAEVIWKHNISPSIYVSAPRILNNGSIEEKAYFDYVHLSVLDMRGGRWVAEKMKENSKIFCGPINERGVLLINGLTSPIYDTFGSLNIFPLTYKTIIPDNSYIYLTQFNTKTGKIKQTGWVFPEYLNITEIEQINLSNKIYTNGGGEIYYYYQY
jgi:uncharacterized membrane protein